MQQFRGGEGHALLATKRLQPILSLGRLQGRETGGFLNIKAPAQKQIVGTYDPNYQTLAGLNNEDVFKRKVGDRSLQSRSRRNMKKFIS